MQKRDFNLFLLVICLFALPLYAAGAVLEALLEGGQKRFPPSGPQGDPILRYRRIWSVLTVALVC